MTVYSKFNIVYQLQKWLDSVPGQTFLNYAYSWGASIVILGTLFKLTHLPGANIMLYLGMGTEVIVFFISAFDRPFDKTAIGKDLPTHLEDEKNDEEAESGADGIMAGSQPVISGGVPGGTIIIGGGQPSSGAIPSADGVIPSANGAIPSADGVVATAGSGAATAAAGGTNAGGSAVPGWIQGQQQVSPEMEEATSNYVDELNRLTEMLSKVAEQSQRLTRDSEEMENLNRTLTGICKVYEMQLKGASAQIGTIDQINEQSRRMAEQIAELNRIYARMIEAMTVNMNKVQS
ncbi:MAG: gliding motility protein GldL [Prevotella sp.]|nr:gliding motility protein GldL [Prevotella sp.]